MKPLALTPSEKQERETQLSLSPLAGGTWDRTKTFSAPTCSPLHYPRQQTRDTGWSLALPHFNPVVDLPHYSLSPEP